jgi:lycopene cyclase domain-containing protein
MKFTYLLVNISSVIVPFLFSFHRKIRFDKKFKAFFAANIITTLCFLAWDAVFTIIRVWGFNDDYITGFKIFNLPVEEILFFICIPFACVFTYHCLNQFFAITWKERTEKFSILSISLFLFATGLINIDRLYTSVTFVSTSLLLIVFKFIFRVTWLPRLISIYPILLIPFFIVNGILTGSGSEHPVVWYNDSENLGIRLFTIPIEDIIYGLEMMLLNLFFYEKFQKRFTNTGLPVQMLQ